MGRQRDSNFDRLEALCSVSAMLIGQQKRGETANETRLWTQSANKSDDHPKASPSPRQSSDQDLHRGLSQHDHQCHSYNSASDGSQMNSISQLASFSASDTDGAAYCGKASFIAKLCEMLNDDASDGLVRWGVEGRSIVVTDPNGFSQVMLPRYDARLKLREIPKDTFKIILAQNVRLRPVALVEIKAKEQTYRELRDFPCD